MNFNKYIIENKSQLRKGTFDTFISNDKDEETDIVVYYTWVPAIEKKFNNQFTQPDTDAELEIYEVKTKKDDKVIELTQEQKDKIEEMIS